MHRLWSEKESARRLPEAVGVCARAKIMNTLDSTVYTELLDLLAESADPHRIAAFRLSAERQERLDELLERNRTGAISGAESAELDAFEHFEHVVRMLKARAMQKAAS